MNSETLANIKRERKMLQHDIDKLRKEIIGDKKAIDIKRQRLHDLEIKHDAYRETIRLA